MSGEREILRDAILPDDLGTKPYVLKLVLYAIDSRRKCTAALDRLEKDMNLPRSTLKRALKILEELQILSSKKYRDGRSYRCERKIDFERLREFTGPDHDPMNDPLTGSSSSPVKNGSQVQNAVSQVQNGAFTGSSDEPRRRKKALKEGVCMDFEESKKWNPRLSAGEFKSLRRGLSRFEQAREAGAISGGEVHRLRFLVLWRHVGRRIDEGKVRSHGGLFMSLFNNGVTGDIWEGTEHDEEVVRNFLKESRDTGEPTPELACAIDAMGVDNEILKGLSDD